MPQSSDAILRARKVLRRLAHELRTVSQQSSLLAGRLAELDSVIAKSNASLRHSRNASVILLEVVLTIARLLFVLFD